MKYPDSFCGRSFTVNGSKKKGEEEEESEPCFIHSGFYKVRSKKSKDGIWTCCQAEERDAKGCQEGSHAHYDYPDEEAKKYNFDKPIKVTSEELIGKTDFEIFGRFSGYFRVPIPYVSKNPG